MKKFIISVILAAMAGGAAYYFFWMRKSAGSQPQTEESAKSKVERGAIKLTVSSTGRVVSNLDVDIKCKASGEVVKLPFDISNSVKKGDLLVELDPVDEQRNVRLAEVALEVSKAKLEQAKLNLVVLEKTLATDTQRAEAALKNAAAHRDDARSKADRFKALLEKKLSSQEEYESANTTAIQAETDLENAHVKMDELKVQEIALGAKRQDVVQAQAAVESDNIALSNAKQRLEDTKVMSPMDGVVAARNVQIGQIISSAISNVGGGTTVLTLSDLSRIFAVASVDESDIGKVTVGQTSVVTADAYPNKRFRGEVTRIATRGVNLSNVVTFEVQIEVTSDNKSLLKPEMTTNVAIIVAEKENVLLAPSDAVLFKGGKRTATVVKADGTQEGRSVEAGINDGTKVEIVSGLAEGDIVLEHKNEAESRWRAAQKGPSGMSGPMMMGGPPKGR
jgi:HlyD family secretion protein